LKEFSYFIITLSFLSLTLSSCEAKKPAFNPFQIYPKYAQSYNQNIDINH